VAVLESHIRSRGKSSGREELLESMEVANLVRISMLSVPSVEQNTRINPKEGNQLKFKKQKRETFLGSLRCNVDKETEDILRPMLPLYRREIDGRIFYHYADGHVETISRAELMKEKAEEVMRRWAQNESNQKGN